MKKNKKFTPYTQEEEKELATYAKLAGRERSSALHRFADRTRRSYPTAYRKFTNVKAGLKKTKGKKTYSTKNIDAVTTLHINENELRMPVKSISIINGEVIVKF